jgi:DNA-binding NtrC family response regulator
VFYRNPGWETGRLHLSQTSPELSHVVAFERAKLSGHRILIVEDEMLITLGLIDIVAGLGASWVAASRVAKALALVATEPFDAAFLDMNLAGESGGAVADALSACDMPFVITTGYGVEGIPEKYRSLPRLSKPYMPEQVEAALLNVLATSKSVARSA